MATIPANVIAAAQASQAATGIPASVSIAQWAVESAWGVRCTGMNNYFGIKATPGQPQTLCATHEVIGGKRVLVNAAFAVYGSLEDAFTAHAALLAHNPRYAVARALLPDVEAFVNAMAPIYATDPGYAALILQIIHGHQLQQFDTVTA